MLALHIALNAARELGNQREAGGIA